MADPAAELTIRVAAVARRLRSSALGERDDDPTTRELLDRALAVLAPTRHVSGADQLRRDSAGEAAASRITGGEQVAPLDRLAARLGLSPFEVDVLVLAGLPEEHEDLAVVVRRLNPYGHTAVTPALALAALCVDEDRPRVRQTLEDGPLVRSGALLTERSLPFWDRPLRPANDLWAALGGVRHLPAELQPLATPNVAGLDGWLDRDAGAAAAVQACRSLSPRLIVVTAPDAADAAARAAAVVVRAGGEPLLVPSTSLAHPADHGMWTLQALVRDLVPVVVADEDVTLCPLPAHPGPVLVAVTPATSLEVDDRPVLRVTARPFDLRERQALWSQALPAANGDADTLAGLLRVEPHRAWQAVADLTSAAALNGGRPAWDPSSVVSAVRARMGLRLPPSVRLVEPVAGWDDLVLGADQFAQLHEAAGRARHQTTVLAEWGLGERRRGVAGTRLLFAGPPGTGKTLAAEVLAREFGLDLLVVDLAAVVSKWLGETEKNLAAVFDVAEAAQAVLLFDEADALFARRTEVTDAHSRWANLETSYLLGRLEAFEGIAILATNLRHNLDAAFVRRLEFVVEFDEPGREERRRLWEAHLPAGVPRAADVDVAELARVYPVAGGVIRNAALAAAFAAAAAGRRLRQAQLVAALRREYQKAGRSFPGAPRGVAEHPVGT